MWGKDRRREGRDVRLGHERVREREEERKRGKNGDDGEQQIGPGLADRQRPPPYRNGVRPADRRRPRTHWYSLRSSNSFVSPRPLRRPLHSSLIGNAPVARRSGTG